MFDAPWILAQQTESVWSQLDPQTRAKVLATFAGLIILGFAMMALTWLGGRATRRYMGMERKSRREETEFRPDDWAHKPLVPPLDESPTAESE